MQTEFAQLAHWYAGHNVIGWYASRKLNGWGCIWDGGITRGQVAERVPWYFPGGDYRLKTRPVASGLWTIGRENKPKVINAPSWFINQLPIGIPLHGELWYEDNLAFVKSVCGQGERGCRDPRWAKIQYLIYNSKPYSEFKDVAKFLLDIGANTIGLTPYWGNFSWKDRMAKVKEKLVETHNLLLLPQVPVSSEQFLNTMLDTALASGHEGLMLVNPYKNYESCRSSNLLKVKPEFETEATIIGFEGGEGRHMGRVGALKCELVWDDKVLNLTGGAKEMIGRRVEFKIGGGLTDGEREWGHFKLNDLVPFTFLCVSQDGIPCHANYNRGASDGETIS